MSAMLPTPRGHRLELLDALRGFALAVVFWDNLRNLSLFGFLSDESRAGLPTAEWDRIFAIVMSAFVEQTGMTIFTFLFGVGFAMQMQRTAEAGIGMRYYYRRLVILLAIGIVHSLFWFGDILRFYAVMGLFLIPMARLSARTLALVGSLIALTTLPVSGLIVDLAGIPSTVPNQVVESAAAAFTGSSMWRVFQANFSYDLWATITQWTLPLGILGRFLIGAAFGRGGVLSEPQKHAVLWGRIFSFTAPLGCALTAFTLFREHGSPGSTWEWRTTPAANTVMELSDAAASLSLTLAYVSGFVLLFQRTTWRRWMNLLSPVGQMALTNYLLQTAVGMILFYGIGLGIGPRFGLAALLPFSVLVFIGQIAVSRWWLQRFNFGPVEWLWRRLTYCQPLQMRRPLVSEV
jgi:uncharacterized protein